MITLLVLILVVIVLWIFASFLYYKYDMAKTKNIPGPYPLPVVGNGHKFVGTSFQFVQTLSDFIDTYGEIARLYILNDRFVIMSNPKHIEAIIAGTEFITKSISYTYLYPWLGQGLLTATGHRWYAHRKLLTGAFHFNILKTFLPIFTKNDDIVTQKLRSVADGKPVDIFPIMALVALDNISEAAMGVSVNALQDSESEYVTTVNKFSELLFERMKHPIWGINAIFNMSPQKTTHDKALAILHGFTKKVIEDRRKVLEESKTTLENYDATTIEILKLITRLLHKFGDVIIFYVISQRYIFITNPKYVEAVMSSSDYNTKAGEYRYLHPWLGQGLLTATGNRWRTHRKLLTPSFHFNILKTFLPVFLKNDEIFVKKLEVLANGKPINVFPILALLALDNISETAMGVSVNAQVNSESKYVQAVNDLSELLFARMRKVFLRYDFLFNLLPHKRRQDAALVVLHQQTTSVIRERRQVLDESHITLENYDPSNNDLGIKKKSAFLDLLLLSTVEGKKLDDETIREEVDTFMFEGHDTTTSGLSFSCYCISQNQSVQDKLFDEQKQIFGNDFNRHPTTTDLNEMKYLEAVIKESLRLYPSVPIIARMVFEEKKIGDTVIPKNTGIVIGIMHMHRDPKLFKDPLSFRPERYESMPTDQKTAYNWIAFSAGSRNCIGQKFAMMELKVVLSSIIRRFKLLPSGIEPILCGDLVLRSENGVHVGFLPRKL